MSDEIKRPVTVKRRSWGGTGECFVVEARDGYVLSARFLDRDDAECMARCINAYPKLLAALREAQELIYDLTAGMDPALLEPGQYQCWEARQALLRELDGEGTDV